MYYVVRVVFLVRKVSFEQVLQRSGTPQFHGSSIGKPHGLFDNVKDPYGLINQVEQAQFIARIRLFLFGRQHDHNTIVFGHNTLQDELAV